MFRRAEQVELANAALVARNKVLEVLSNSQKKQEIEEEVKGKLQRQKDHGSITTIKNDIVEGYEDRILLIKKALATSKLSQNNFKKVETILRDNGADYF